MKAKIHPEYIAMTQQPYCCLPTCVQMILYRRGLQLLEQEIIGIDLGLKIPKEELHNFENVSIGKRPPAGWGTRINVKKYNLNGFFKKRGYPLESAYFSVEDIKSVPRFIANNLKQGNDILICFQYGRLYNVDIKDGHASLIEEIDDKKIILVDPQANKKRRIVNFDDLIESIVLHKRRNVKLGGFWVISKKS